MSSLEELYAGTGLGETVGSITASLDIVAIHGLNPRGSKTHALDTWQDQESRNLWLRDRIPYQQPNARIFIYEYNSSPVFGSSQGRFMDEANQFLECLRLERRKNPTRPLILLGHSLGGILIKQALVNAFNNPKYRDIKEATYGLVFFGTPHGGPGEDWKIGFGKASVRIAQSLPGVQSNDIMEALKHGSLFSDALQSQWRHQLNQYQIVTFYEGIGDIVPQSSATIGLPGDRESQIKLQAKHSDMCKFNPNDAVDKKNYKFVEGNVLELCEKSLQLDKIGFDPLIKELERGGRNPRRNGILNAQGENMQWIWNTQDPNPGFIDWLQSKGRIFWISGKPGAGKSTLMKQLVECKQILNFLPIESGSVITVSYFFYELGQPQEKLFRSLLQAILHALLLSFQDTDHNALSSVVNILKPQLGSHSGGGQQINWRDDKLEEALYQSLAACQNTVQLLLFVDGMDECEGDHREQLDFLNAWIESSSESKLCIKACLASRDELEIRLRLSTYPSLAIHQFTRANIVEYVTKRLRAAWELMAVQPDHTTTRFDQHLIDDVVYKAEGVFLWVNLVVTQLVISIEEEVEAQKLSKQLYDLPNDLQGLYARTVAKIPQENLHDAINFLRMFDHNINPLRSDVIRPDVRTLWEFCAAAHDPSTAISCKASFEKRFHEESIESPRNQCIRMKRRLQRSCKGLIHVGDTKDLQTAEVSLLHQTVKEYIIKDVNFGHTVARVDQRLIRDSNTSLMAMSLRLLKADPDYMPNWIDWVSPENAESTSLDEREEKDHYIYDGGDADIVYFFFHAAAAASRSTGSSCQPYIDELDRILSHLHQNWAAMYYRSLIDETRSNWNTDVLSLAILHRIDLYVEEAFKANGRALFFRVQRPLLFYAFDFGGVYFNPNIGVVDLLLSYGADPNEYFESSSPWATDPSEQFQSGTPWVLAVRNGLTEFCRDFLLLWIQRLLKYGADPTQRAMRESFDDWKNDLRVHVPETLQYTTTFHVLLSCLGFPDDQEQKDIITLFLDHCKDFDAVDSDGTTISSWADQIDKRLGSFVREEIAARTTRKRAHALCN